MCLLWSRQFVGDQSQNYSIFTVVAMIPMQPVKGDYSPLFFLVDKPGLDTLSSVDVNNAYDVE